MFKFMKSKKGFTLVELMIVVVIMAILVAVAVPVFSAVTTKAKTKSCISNMREITSQISNFAMGETNYDCVIKYTPDADGKVATDSITITGTTKLTVDQYVGLFQAGAPACPSGGEYTVTVEPTGTGDQSGSIKVSVACANSADGHVYGN